MVYWKELVFSVLPGKADLESPAHGIVIANLSVSFDAQNLVFEISLDVEHPLVWELAQEYESSDLWLKRLEISMPNNAGVLRADSFCLPLRRGMSEWPEVLGIRQADYADFEKPETVRRLLLSPSKKLLEFQIDDDLLTGNHACYTGWEMMFLKPASLKLSPDGDEIKFDTSQADRSLISFSSAADFWGVEERIQTGLSLAQGRNLQPVFKVERGKCLFYGGRDSGGKQALAMLQDGGGARELLDQLLYGICRLEEERFAKARLAIRFFLLGKQAVLIEQAFLQAMICVEAMDEVHGLKETTTAVLLGVPCQVAKLINEMRNKLVHGEGGFQRAFEHVKKIIFKGSVCKLEQGFEMLLTERGELEFFLLWLRLCERLDAYWCSYVGVAPELLQHRNRWFQVPLMSAVDWRLVEPAAAAHKCLEKKRKNQIEERKKLWEVTYQENLRLHEELRILRGQLAQLEI